MLPTSHSVCRQEQKCPKMLPSSRSLCQQEHLYTIRYVEADLILNPSLRSSQGCQKNLDILESHPAFGTPQGVCGLLGRALKSLAIRRTIHEAMGGHRIAGGVCLCLTLCRGRLTAWRACPPPGTGRGRGPACWEGPKRAMRAESRQACAA